MLVEMLNQSEKLNKETPLPQKVILLRLAHIFESSTEYLFLTPEELEEKINIGTKDQWMSLLELQETKNYIKGQMAFLAQISQRKTFAALVSMALAGGQGAAGAAKQIQELSGIMNQQDTNRTIVLHRIPRPYDNDKQINQTEETNV